MVHLLERHHNERFLAILSKHLPNWKHLKDELNRLPLDHSDWVF
jgi:predicted metal-dependent hydrolase